MKNLTCALALTAAILPTTSIADTKNFEGFSGSLNMSLVSSGIKLTGDGLVGDGLGGKQEYSAGVDLGYGVKLSDTGIFTVGIDADFVQPTVFTLTADGDTLTAKQKNRFGIYFAPGTVIGKDTLIYGKVGYNSMKGEVTGSGGWDIRRSETFTGFGYGLGIKTMISPQAFLKIELNRLSFGSETVGAAQYKPSATTGVLGIGTSF